LAANLEGPYFDRSELGFRYKNPGLEHFCLLRAARIVSGLNASIELARLGYTQEIGVLFRTLNEYSNQVNFVLIGILERGEISVEATNYIASYFRDAHRDTSSKHDPLKLKQKRVHDAVGTDLDAFKEKTPTDSRATTELLSNVYLRFSYYVHARYPESMDLFGGTPGKFHLRGMSRTPKDHENILVLTSVITSVSLCLKGIVQNLRLHAIIESDPILKRWINKSEM
jgi:hypothetical protein